MDRLHKGRKRGTACRTGEIKEAVGGKRRAYTNMLQINVAGEIGKRRRNRGVKELVKDSKMIGRKLSENFSEIKKKEVNRERGGRCMCERVKREDRVLVSTKEMKGAWTVQIKHLINDETSGKEVMLSISTEAGVCVELR